MTAVSDIAELLTIEEVAERLRVSVLTVRWLTASILSLAVLATASAAVSYAAQYRMVFATKGTASVAALEAAIPDLAALIFATLGIALALHGKRAIRARVLNVAAVVGVAA